MVRRDSHRGGATIAKICLAVDFGGPIAPINPFSPGTTVRITAEKFDPVRGNPPPSTVLFRQNTIFDIYLCDSPIARQARYHSIVLFSVSAACGVMGVPTQQLCEFWTNPSTCRAVCSWTESDTTATAVRRAQGASLVLPICCSVHHLANTPSLTASARRIARTVVNVSSEPCFDPGAAGCN